MVYYNAIQAVWLDYTTNYIIEQDLNLIDYYEKGDQNFDNKVIESKK